MKLPSVMTSGETLLETFGVYHLARLKAENNLKDMADAFEAAQGRLKSRIEAYKSASASAMTAMAIRDGEDAALDDAIERLALDILKSTGNSRKSPLYLKYFPEGLTRIVNATLESEIQKAGVILSKLGEEDDEIVKSHLGPIKSSVDSLSQAIDAHKAALEVEMQAYGMIQAEKVNWLDLYKKDYRDLARMFYKEPKKADTFFKSFHKTKKNDESIGSPQVAQKC